MSYLDQYFLKYLYYSLTVFILIFLNRFCTGSQRQLEPVLADIGLKMTHVLQTGHNFITVTGTQTKIKLCLKIIPNLHLWTE